METWMRLYTDMWLVIMTGGMYNPFPETTNA